MRTEGKKSLKPTRKFERYVRQNRGCIPKGIKNQIFLRNRQEKYFDKEEWASWLFETNGKYRRVHRKGSGEIIEREEGIEHVDKLIKDKPEFGDYGALLPGESWSWGF